MESFVSSALLLVVSVFAGFCSSSTVLFTMHDVYSELNAYGHVTVGRHDDPLSWTSAHDDPSSILIKLLDARFLDSTGEVLHEANIGKIPVPYEYYYEGDEERTVLFRFPITEIETYQNITALGRQMATVFSDAKVKLTLSVYIFMRAGVVNKGSVLEQRVERGQVRLDLEMERTEPCAPDCPEVAMTELEIWVRGPGPITSTRREDFTDYSMGQEALLTLPHKVTNNGSPSGVLLTSTGHDTSVEVNVRTPLPDDTSKVLYSISISPAVAPEPEVTESAGADEYQDQQPNSDEKTSEVKDGEGNAASKLHSSTAIFILTLFSLKLWKYFL